MDTIYSMEAREVDVSSAGEGRLIIEGESNEEPQRGDTIRLVRQRNRRTPDRVEWFHVQAEVPPRTKHARKAFALLVQAVEEEEVAEKAPIVFV